MWLRNYYNILTAQMLCDDSLTSTTQPTDYDPPVMIRRPNGNWANVYMSQKAPNVAVGNTQPYIIPPFLKGFSGNTAVLAVNETSSVGASNAIAIGLGTGTAAVDYDDYKLGNMITSGLALVSGAGTLAQASTYDSGTHHMSSERTFTINNTSASPITVSEVGIYAHYDNNANSNSCLIYRDVFTPVTLQPGESCIISFKRDAEVYNYTPY